MEKIYWLVFTWCWVMLGVGEVTAQERLMFSVSGGAPGGLYYLDKNGGEEIHACNFNPTNVLGYGPEHFIVSKDGELVGVNSAGGMLETEEEVGYGTMYRMTAKGVVKVQDFGYAEASNTFLTEGVSDGKLYGIGPTALGMQMLQGTKYSRLTGTEVFKYGIRPGELMAANNGAVYGTAPIGSGTSQGYIYRSIGTNITTVYNFTKPTGHYPQGKLMQGSDGYIYGVTKRGGTMDYGVIYKIKTDGTGYSVLHHFDKVNGMYPDRGLVQDASGNLYGMTFAGGNNGLGVVYKIRPEGTGFTKIHDFTVKQQYYSGVPQSLLLDASGFLYGRVPQSQSIIFRIKTDGTNFRILYNKNVYISTLQLVSSITPDCKLTDPANGAMGVAVSRTFVADSVPGAVSYKLEIATSPDFNTASIFSIAYTMHRRPYVTGLNASTKYYARLSTSLWSRPGPITSFTTASASTSATSVVTTPAKGSTNASAPTLKVTVKAVTGAKRYTVQLNNRFDFAGTMFTQTSAVDDQRTLTFTGLRYSIKYYARVKTNNNENWGPIISFTTSAEVFPYVVSPDDGASEIDKSFVQASVLPLTGAKIYTVQLSTSTTFSSSTTKTFTSIDDNQSTFLLRDLNPSTKYYTRVRTDISTKYGPVKSFTTRAAIRAMRIVGANYYGGDNGLGTIFSFSLDSMKYTKHYDSEDWRISPTDIVHGPEGFYGAQHADNNNGTGRIFKYNFETGYHASENISVNREVDLMIASNGMVYATHSYAPFGNGAIYKLKPSLDDYARIHFYRSETGVQAYAPLLEYSDGFLYGTTIWGGLYNRGVIYRMRGNGKDYQVIFNFNNYSYMPAGGLVDGHDGFLYGTTNSGNGNFGTVYKVKPDGSVLIFLHAFNYTDGAYPQGELLVENGIIYGVAGSGGSNEIGVLYKVNIFGEGFKVLKHFTDPYGAYPINGVVSDGKGNLYGCTPYGGSEGFGSIYHIKTDGTGYKILYEMTEATFRSGMYPFGKIALVEDPYALKPAATSSFAHAVEIDVFPNPSTDVFNLKTGKKETGVAIELVDFAGNIVYRNSLKGEDLTIGEGLPRGIYILKVRDGNAVSERRLVKK